MTNDGNRNSGDLTGQVDEVGEVIRSHFGDVSGGRTAQRGFYYQNLYALRSISRLLRGEIDGCVSEYCGDFVFWKLEGSGIREFTIVDCKYRSGVPVTERLNELRRVVDGLHRHAERLHQKFSTASIRVSVVFPSSAEYDSSENMILSSAVGLPLWLTAESESFLDSQLTDHSLRQEIASLIQFYPPLVERLTTSDSISRFVESLMGVTLPFFRKADMGAWLDGTVKLGADKLSRASAVSRLRRIIAQFLVDQSVSAFQDEFENARMRAATILRAAPVQQQSSFRVSNFDAAVHAIAIAQAVEGEGIAPSLGHRRTKGKYFEILNTDGLTPLSTYLSEHPGSHWHRVKLILSFANTVANWARSGVALTDEFDSSAEEWFVRTSPPEFDGRSVNCEFFTSEVSKLVSVGEKDWLLPPKWQPAEVLARCILRLYYGTLDRRSEQEIQLQYWQDGIVEKLAKKLGSSGIIDVGCLCSLTASTLGFCINGWPIFISDPEHQFVTQAIGAGMNPPASQICLLNLKGASWLVSGSRNYEQVLYIQATSSRTTETVQVGLRYDAWSSWDLHCRIPFKLLRLYRYGTTRWTSRWTEDNRNGISFPRHWQNPVFVAVEASHHVDSILTNVFNLDPNHYRTDLNRYLPKLEVFGSQLSDSILREIAAELEVKQKRLWNLQRKCFVGSLNRDAGRLVIKLSDKTRPDAVFRHLELNRYLPEVFHQLRVRLNRNNTRLNIDHLIGDGTIWLTEQTPLEVEENTPIEFWIEDSGTDNVLSYEARVVEDLRMDFEERRQPLSGAYQFMCRIMSGESGSQDRLPKGRLAKIAKCASSIRNSQECSFMLTGAPGTGKSRFLAELLISYLGLDTNEEFPPRRILLVANTHFALENFLNVFLEIDVGQNIAIVRPLSKRKRSQLLATNTLDPDILDEMDRRAAGILGSLPQITPPVTETHSLAEQAKAIEGMLVALQSNNTQCAPVRSTLFGSHERACHVFGEECAHLPSERLTKISVLKDMLRSLKETPASNGPIAEGVFDSEVLSVFGAQIVVDTVDGAVASSKPDIGYDLIVFEEASQVSPIGVLKVIHRAMRAAHNDSRKLNVILSGDPAQLPQFRDDRDVKALYRLRGTQQTDFFRTAWRTHAAYRMTLTTQYRMHREIADLVQSAFYPNESWRVRRKCPRSRFTGAWWVETAIGCEQQNVKTGSWYSEEEIEAVCTLVDIIQRESAFDGSVLVVTPYSAQETRLQDRLPESIRVKTIDGSQGIEADIVIVSFVRFGAEFCTDPRRINVAVSRARDCLVCVGSLEALSQVEESSLNQMSKYFTENTRRKHRVLRSSEIGTRFFQ